MNMKQIDENFSVSGQLTIEDLKTLEQQGVKTLICNRPDNEEAAQQSFDGIDKAASQLGMEVIFLPVIFDTMRDADVNAFEQAWDSSSKPVHAYCRSGTRSLILWALMQIKQGRETAEILQIAAQHGYDFSNFRSRFAAELAQYDNKDKSNASAHYEILIVGAGSAGIATASSLLKRNSALQIALIDPARDHYYQPGFTMVGGGIFNSESTRRDMESLIPSSATWIQEAVSGFVPEENLVLLNNGKHLAYDRLIVCPGIKLDWEAIPGLSETLGKNGVTSNYRPDLAAYTWELVQQLKSGKALFTQPPMPIKCAGAPQKALYLSADHWQQQNRLKDIDTHFYIAGGALFGVKDYVPALQAYIDRYGAQTHYNHNLTRIDGDTRTAWFTVTDAEGNQREISSQFDMIHVCPPQCAPDFIRASPISDDSGWVDVDQHSLRHKRYNNVWALGDVIGTSNAKTAAAVRKQAPVIAANIIAEMKGEQPDFSYAGYGACPLTVERGKVVLAEFGYGGQLQPTLPKWLINGLQPSTQAWRLKKDLLPAIYWHCMLKGREWLVTPKRQ